MDGVGPLAGQEGIEEAHLVLVGERDLRSLDGLRQPRHGPRIFFHRRTLSAQTAEHPLAERVVDVVASEVGVAAASPHFEQAFIAFEDGDVERAAAQVVDQDQLLGTGLVGQGGGGGFVHQPLHRKPRHRARVARRLPLRLAEIRRDRDDGPGRTVPDRGLGSVEQRTENERGNLRWRKQLGPHRQARLGAHLSFHGDHRARRIEQPAVLRGSPHVQLAGRSASDHGGQKLDAGTVGEEFRLAVHHRADEGVGRPQIDADRKLLAIHDLLTGSPWLSSGGGRAPDAPRLPLAPAPPARSASATTTSASRRIRSPIA